MSELLENWVTTSEAMQLTGYTRSHLLGLARRQTINSQRLGPHMILLDRAALLAYRAAMKKLGTRKHDRWHSTAKLLAQADA